jgi:hypothetical protein
MRSPAMAKTYAANSQPIQLYTVDKLFCGWKQAQEKHFDDRASSIKFIKRNSNGSSELLQIVSFQRLRRNTEPFFLEIYRFRSYAP